LGREPRIPIPRTGRDQPGRIGTEPVKTVGCHSIQLVKDRACIGSVGGVAEKPLINLTVVWELSNAHRDHPPAVDMMAAAEIPSPASDWLLTGPESAAPGRSLVWDISQPIPDRAR
jgi:hypothetical protein